MNKFLFLFLLSLSSPFAFAGTEGGNGGDQVGNGGDGQVIEFRNLALSLAEKLQQLNGSCQALLPFRPLELTKMAYRARIESSEKELTLRGQRVEAINYPALGKILFHSPSFTANKNKPQFVVHEFLGLLNFADLREGEEYGLSKFLIEISTRPECQSLVSKRRWINKSTKGDKVYFQFDFPGELLTYDLKTGIQLPAISAPLPAKNFSLWKDVAYFGYAQKVCTPAGNCLPGSQVPYLLHDFAIHGNRLLESVQGVKQANDFFENYYKFENVQIAPLNGGEPYSFRLETYPNNENKMPNDPLRYSLARKFVELGPHQSIALADQYAEDSVTAYSLVRMEWNENTGPQNETHVNRGPEIVVTHLWRKKEYLRVTQKFFYASTSAVPQELFATQEGKFVLTDDGSVFDATKLQRVAVIEAPIEDAIPYGDYTIILSAGRILVYDQAWHQQGEFNPSVAPQGIAISGDTLSLFSMLSDSKLFVEKHDVNDFFKKKRNCFMSKEDVLKFKPEQIINLGKDEFALAAAQGCVLKKESSGWQPWMGMQKNSAAALALAGNLLVVDANSTVHLLDLLKREDTLIAKFAMEFVSAKIASSLLELTMHHPAHTKDYQRRVLLSPEGKIMGDRWFFTQHER